MPTTFRTFRCLLIFLYLWLSQRELACSLTRNDWGQEIISANLRQWQSILFVKSALNASCNWPWKFLPKYPVSISITYVLHCHPPHVHRHRKQKDWFGWVDCRFQTVRGKDHNLRVPDEISMYLCLENELDQGYVDSTRNTICESKMLKNSFDGKEIGRVQVPKWVRVQESRGWKSGYGVSRWLTAVFTEKITQILYSRAVHWTKWEKGGMWAWVCGLRSGVQKTNIDLVNRNQSYIKCKSHSFSYQR